MMPKQLVHYNHNLVSRYVPYVGLVWIIMNNFPIFKV